MRLPKVLKPGLVILLFASLSSGGQTSRGTRWLRGHAWNPRLSPSPAWPRPGGGTTAYEASRSIENEFYRASFNLWTGELMRLVVKPRNWEALGGACNVVARKQDGGQLWELYGTLQGESSSA